MKVITIVIMSVVEILIVVVMVVFWGGLDGELMVRLGESESEMVMVMFWGGLGILIMVIWGF